MTEQSISNVLVIVPGLTTAGTEVKTTTCTHIHQLKAGITSQPHNHMKYLKFVRWMILPPIPLWTNFTNKHQKMASETTHTWLNQLEQATQVWPKCRVCMRITEWLARTLVWIIIHLNKKCTLCSITGYIYKVSVVYAYFLKDSHGYSCLIVHTHVQKL